MSRVSDPMATAGLSPRARGNRPSRGSALRPAGSIPASAGEPLCQGISRRLRRVYPRERGGTLRQHRQTSKSWGLSPRARGNPEPCRPGPVDEGSIPASAGNHRVKRGLRADERVYPRERGGTTRYVHEVGTATGLSPRARGNRSIPRRLHERLGSIPASAGNPGRGPHVAARRGSIPASAGEPLSVS